MPENTLRMRPSPTSSVRRSSLVEPSTASQLTIFAMRRSIFVKSSMVMVGASVLAARFTPFPLGRAGVRALPPPAARTAHPAASRPPAASGACTRRPGGPRPAAWRHCSSPAARIAGRPRPAAASAGSTGFRQAVSTLNASRHSEQTSAAFSLLPSLTSFQGAAASKRSVHLVGEGHDLAQRLAVVARFVQVAHVVRQPRGVAPRATARWPTSLPPGTNFTARLAMFTYLPIRSR